jgi:hypothetical protein
MDYYRSAVAAPTGRGFESRQPDKFLSPRINIDETQIVHGEDPHRLV